MGKNKNKKKTIGELTNSRLLWGINPITRVTKNKKGKGSYNRKEDKNEYKYKG